MRTLGLLGLALLFAACRNSDGGPTGITLVPSSAGANGCSGPDQTFTPPQTPAPVVLATLQIGPLSQITSAGDAELLYATGANATVVSLDVSIAPPVEVEIVAAGQVAALLTALSPPINTAPELSGIAVLDAGTLLVMEHTSNTILAVDRTAGSSPQVLFWAGLPDENGGFADGPALAVTGGPGQARFHFSGPGALLPTAPAGAFVFVADTGNHAVRSIGGGFVSTLAGTGSPFFKDGSLQQAGFDSPAGLSLSCAGKILVTERGSRPSGNRLRQIQLGPKTFFGQTGTVITRAGDGTNATLQGDGVLAMLAAPLSPLATSGQDVYWIDSSTGILRRMRGASDTCDCPLSADCATAVSNGGDFTPGGVLSLTQTPAGLLFVMDATAGVLFRVSP
jgi:hypothetical protein